MSDKRLIWKVIDIFPWILLVFFFQRSHEGENMALFCSERKHTYTLTQVTRLYICQTKLTARVWSSSEYTMKEKCPLFSVKVLFLFFLLQYPKYTTYKSPTFLFNHTYHIICHPKGWMPLMIMHEFSSSTSRDKPIPALLLLKHITRSNSFILMQCHI